MPPPDYKAYNRIIVFIIVFFYSIFSLKKMNNSRAYFFSEIEISDWYHLIFLSDY